MSIVLPPIAEERLPNGLRVIAMHRKGPPLAATRLVLRAGSALDPARRFGLAHLATEAMRRGSKKRSGREIDDTLESLGAELGNGVDEDAAYFGVTAPAEYLGRALDVMADLAIHPTFPRAEVERLRRREIASLRRDLDEPAVVADRAMLQAAYGVHPYAHTTEGRAADVKAMRTADIAGFHRRWVGPQGGALVLVGDLDPAAGIALAKKRFGAWKPAPAEPTGLVPPAEPAPAVWVVDKPDATQTQVRIARPALARATPDFHAAIVANAIFGGGFTSRLMDEIRVNRGLSYGARSRFAMSRAGGLFFVSTFTKNESTLEILEVALAEAKKFCEGGPTAEELDRARSWLAGLYPLQLETHSQLADKLGDLHLYGLGLEEVTEYRERIRAVTAEQCVAVARRFFPVGKGVIVAVGRAKEIAKPLEKLGEVTVMPAAKFV